MTNQQLRDNLPHEIDPKYIFVAGSVYAAVESSWLQGTFYNYFQTGLFDKNLDKWIPKWVCQEFSANYRVSANECNATAPNTPNNADSLTIGEIWFIPDASRYGTKIQGSFGEGHAINMCLTEIGWQFLDPQTNIIWNMSETELKSIYFCRF